MFGYVTRMKKRSCRGFCGRVGWRTLLHEIAWRHLRTLGGVIAAAALRIWSISSSTVCLVCRVQCWIFIWFDFFCGCKYVPTHTHGCNRTAQWGMRPPMQEPLAATWDPARSRYVNLKVWTAPGFTQTGPMPRPSLPLRASCQKQRRQYGLRGVKLTRPDK